MKPNRWMGAAALAAALLGAPRLSWAVDPPPQVSAEDDARATKFLSEGNKAFKAGKFADAERAYEQAFAVKKVHDIAGNLAMSEFAQGKMRDAAEHLAFALRLFPLTGEPAQREQMQKTYDQCKGSVGSVRLTVNVREAQVYVDGNLIGEAPLADAIFLDPGEHTIEARKPEEYKPASQKVKADKGVALEVTLTMEALPKAKPKEVIVEVPQKRRSPIPAVVMGAGALVAAGAGVGLFLLSNSKQNQALTLDKQIGRGGCYVSPPDKRCADLDSKARSVDTFRYVSVGTFIGAGVLAVGTLTYLVWPTPKPHGGTHTEEDRPRRPRVAGRGWARRWDDGLG